MKSKIKFKVFAPKSIYTEEKYEEVEGYKVVIEGYESLHLAVYKMHTGFWNVQELKSGLRLSSGTTKSRKAAIESARDRLSQYSEDKMKAIIEKLVKEDKKIVGSLNPEITG